MQGISVTLSPTSCRTAWQNMVSLSAAGPVRNHVELLDMSDYVVETELFPAAALCAYSAWNMEKDVTVEQQQYMNALRGGAQGDYREGMAQKIANVVDCLAQYPQSKRAVIAISNQPLAAHHNDADAKCVREIHLYVDDDGRLSGAAYLRAQAALLFPKNVHMIGSIMTEVARSLPQQPDLGTLFYVTTILVADRS